MKPCVRNYCWTGHKDIGGSIYTYFSIYSIIILRDIISITNALRIFQENARWLFFTLVNFSKIQSNVHL